jgi:hypothetical protein
MYMLRIPWEREKIRSGLYKCAQVMFTPSLYIVDPEAKKTMTRFGASAVKYYPSTALSAWKRGVSGYFPDWFEKRRIISFNCGGFLVWLLTTIAVLHFVFGFTIQTFIPHFIRRLLGY